MNKLIKVLEVCWVREGDYQFRVERGSLNVCAVRVCFVLCGLLYDLVEKDAIFINKKK